MWNIKWTILAIILAIGLIAEVIGQLKHSHLGGAMGLIIMGCGTLYYYSQLF